MSGFILFLALPEPLAFLIVSDVVSTASATFAPLAASEASSTTSAAFAPLPIFPNLVKGSKTVTTSTASQKPATPRLASLPVTGSFPVKRRWIS